MNKRRILFVVLLFLLQPLPAKELAGVTIPDQITAANEEVLLLNGMGLREKLWIDVYVGALYLPKQAGTAGEVLAQPGAMRIQMDFLYSEVSREKLVNGWRDGFEKNQSAEALVMLKPRIDRFCELFSESAKKGDRIIIDYVPGDGTTVIKNDAVVGTIEGEDFRNALLEIWLGEVPADKGLKRGMLGGS